MKRYFSSFLITLFIYISLATVFFLLFTNTITNNKQKESLPKKISLNQVKIVHPIPKIVEKKVEEEIENRVTKEEPKVEVKPKKEIVAKKKEISKPKAKEKTKKLVEKKVIEKKVAKKITQKVVEKTQIVKEPIKKVVQSTPKVDEKKEFIHKHLTQIRALINQNINYPKRARKMNIQGIVKVKFVILKNGKLSDIIILEGHKLLQKATIEAINKAALNFPNTTTDIELILPITYKLL